MQYQAFIESLEEDDCPGGLEHALQALWYDANGERERGHEIVKQMGDVTAARIHAYLLSNGRLHIQISYWHRRTGSTFPEGMSQEEEWDSLARTLTGFSD